MLLRSGSKTTYGQIKSLYSRFPHAEQRFLEQIDRLPCCINTGDLNCRALDGLFNTAGPCMVFQTICAGADLPSVCSPWTGSGGMHLQQRQKFLDQPRSSVRRS